MAEQNRSGAYTQFVYSPTGFEMQIMNGQSATKLLVPLPGGGEVVYNASGMFYYHSDHLGSFRFGSSYTNRNMYFDLAYAPFGETYATSGSTDISFTGQRQDTVSGLYDFPAREYSIQGRWPSPDPAGLAAVDPTNPQSWNRYAYVMNNPLMYVDPTGMACNGLTYTVHACNSFMNNGVNFGGTWNEFDLMNIPWVAAPQWNSRYNPGYPLPPGMTDDNGTTLVVTATVGGVFVFEQLPPIIGNGLDVSGLLDTGPPYSGDWGALQFQQYQGIRLVKALTPTVCGGGWFAGRGAEVDVGAAHGGAYVIVTQDSQSGNSVGYLLEGGAGPISVGHEGSLNTSSGQVDSSNLLFVGAGDHLGGFAASSGQLGAYGGAFGRIAGAYLNVTSVLACH